MTRVSLLLSSGAVAVGLRLPITAWTSSMLSSLSVIVVGESMPSTSTQIGVVVATAAIKEIDIQLQIQLCNA